MQKTYILLFVMMVSLFLSCTTTQVSVEVPEDVDVPQRILFLAQSGTSSDLFQTVIDLDNNELVILVYDAGMLKTVFRTGILMNPKDYVNMGIPFSSDNPYDPPSNNDSSDTDDSNTMNNTGSSF